MKESSQKNYLLFLLMTVLAFNNSDRLALGLMLQSIKHDLSVTDTELGLLTGIAFAFFYSFMGIPIARWADRGNRITIISITTAMWSVAVVLCGMARSFTQLLLIRVGAAVGEAGCIPTSNSLIADHFNRAERPKAVAIYMLGGPLSIVIGYFVAGWLNEYYGWRTTFLILGVPGLILALLTHFTLRETRTRKAGSASEVSVSSEREPSLKEVVATLWRNVTFRQLVITYSVMAFFGYGILQWQPALFVRSYGLGTGELGTWLAIINGIFGTMGTYGGGVLATRYAASKEHLQLRAMAILYVLSGAITTLIYLATNKYVAFGMIALSLAVAALTNGPMFAVIQTLIPKRMRAIAIALVLLMANLIGMGLGPLAAGALSDAFRPLFGDESLRYALLALCPGYLWGAYHVWRSSRTVSHDLRMMENDGSEVSADENELRDAAGHFAAH